VAYFLSREARAQTQKHLNDQRLLNFSLAVEQSPNSIVITDLNGKIIYVNAAFVSITGYTKDEAMGNNPRILQSGETDPLVYRSMWKCLSAGEPWDGELINKRKNGEFFHEHLRVAPVTQADGTITGYIAIVEDISHRKALEHQIQLDRENLETEVSNRTSELRTQEIRTIGILRAMLDGLIHIDQQGLVLMINDSALEIFGYAEQAELLGQNVTKLMPSGYRDRHNTHLHQYDPANSSKVIGGRIEVDGLKKDGTVFPLELAIKALVDDNGLSFIGAVRDLTTQKRVESEHELARSEAERLAKVKSEFLANMSHEIRTPLNAIIGLSDLCLLGELNNRQRSYLDKIKIASDSLLHIINDVLDFSKIEAGKLQIENTPFVLESIFDQLSSVVAHQAEKQGVELTFDIDNTAKVFLGDPLRLGQILINLSTNAIKFSNSGNVIVKVQMTASDTTHAELLFSVTDQGIGMTPDQLSSIFNPFTQADASTTRKYGGTGLGLTICSRLVENMGGKIWATSAVGTGSVFSFTVKLGIFGADRRMGIAEFAKRLASNSHRPVLIVDDNAISLKSLCTLVGQLGFQYHAACDTAEALDFVNGESLPDYLVCLIDWKMAEADGVECIKRLRVIYQSHGQTPPR
jgi:two-component system, sensor histidine kinase and response regulator